jgi:hypothetical protein
MAAAPSSAHAPVSIHAPTQDAEMASAQNTSKRILPRE